MVVGGVPQEFFSVVWRRRDARHLGAVPADPAFQTFWEFVTLALALLQWADDRTCLPLLGDNLSALSDALQLDGTLMMRCVAQEIAWRKARFGWEFACGHLPAEANATADALSRLEAPDAKPFPERLRGCRQVLALPVRHLWTIPDLSQRVP